MGKEFRPHSPFANHERLSLACRGRSRQRTSQSRPARRPGRGFSLRAVLQSILGHNFSQYVVVKPRPAVDCWRVAGF